MLKFYWLLIVALWLSACSVLEVRRDLDGFIPDYTDPVMVINGVVTPSEVSIDVAPVVDLTELDRNGERPDPSVADAILTVENLSDGSSITIPCDNETRPACRYRGALDVNGKYRMTVLSANYPPVVSDELFFSPELLAAEAVIGGLTPGEESRHNLVVSTTAAAPAYVTVRAFTIPARIGGTSTDLNESFMRQCDFLIDVGSLTFSTECFGTSPARIEGFYSHSRSNGWGGIEGFADSLGITIGTIAKDDFLYFKKLMRPNNAISHYFNSGVELQTSNVSGGFGRIVFINGPTTVESFR